MNRVSRRLSGVAAVAVILAIGSAVGSRVRRPEAHQDSADALNVRTPVPGRVLSTVRRACFDCHSNETRWPWYSELPFASSMLERDVTKGRGQLNFSRWTQYNPFDRADMLDKMCSRATNRTMPPRPYLVLHWSARLGPTEIAELCAWTQREATRLVEGGS